jgi:hypothetical protein
MPKPWQFGERVAWQYNRGMATATDLLTTYLEPLAEDLTPQQAKKILSIKPTDRLVNRVQDLAERANSGTLSEQERAEYEYYVDVDDAIGMLKAKARNLLGSASE